MASDINNVVLCGRLTRDAETKTTTGGLAITNLSLAVNRSVKKNDQWTDEASFFDCTLFGKRGESLSQYLTKGQQVGISGALKQDRWEKDGVKRSKVGIIVDDIQLLGSKSNSEQKRESAQRPDKAGLDNGCFEDDIPF